MPPFLCQTCGIYFYDLSCLLKRIPARLTAPTSAQEGQICERRRPSQSVTRPPTHTFSSTARRKERMERLQTMRWIERSLPQNQADRCCPSELQVRGCAQHVLARAPNAFLL